MCVRLSFAYSFVCSIVAHSRFPFFRPLVLYISLRKAYIAPHAPHGRAIPAPEFKQAFANANITAPRTPSTVNETHRSDGRIVVRVTADDGAEASWQARARTPPLDCGRGAYSDTNGLATRRLPSRRAGGGGAE